MTKPIIVVRVPCKLLYVIQVKEFLIKCLTSWPYLISEFLVAYITIVASDWPRTFFTPKVFLFSIYIYAHNLPIRNPLILENKITKFVASAKYTSPRKFVRVRYLPCSRSFCAKGRRAPGFLKLLSCGHRYRYVCVRPRAIKNYPRENEV